MTAMGEATTGAGLPPSSDAAAHLHEDGHKDGDEDGSGEPGAEYLDAAAHYAGRGSRLSSRFSVVSGLVLTAALVITLQAAPVTGLRPSAIAEAAPEAHTPATPVAPPTPAPKPCPAAPAVEVKHTPFLPGHPTGADKTVSLTFDDGPGEFTPQVLDILRDKGVPAVFFVVGLQVQEFPDHMRRIVAEGHQLGNHTHRHVNLRRMSPERQAAELDEATAAIEAVTGQKPCVFRPPYGSFSDTTVALARERNMATVMWSADTMDWKTPSSFSPRSRDSILRLAQEGAAYANPVVLMHDGGGNPANMLAALPLIIDFYRSQGYRFVDMSGEYADDRTPVGKAPEQSRAEQREALLPTAAEEPRTSSGPWTTCVSEAPALHSSCLTLRR